MTPNLLPLPCPRCGACAVPLIGPGVGQHAARALCRQCGHFLKWLPKALMEKEAAMGSRHRVMLMGEISRYGVSVKYAPSGTHRQQLHRGAPRC